MLIALIGKKGSGKDTVADYIVEKYGFYKYQFAKPLKDICKILFNFSDEQLFGDQKEIIDERWNITPRQAFQIIGTEIFQYKFPELLPEFQKKIDKNLWVKIAENFIVSNINYGNIVISDLRFQHEYEMLKKFDVKIIKIDRSILNNEIDCHISENDFKFINTDYVIYNETLDQLYIYIDLCINMLNK